MKHKIKNQNPRVLKVRNKLHQDEIYYTVSTWETRMIDGVEFLTVTKTKPYESNVSPKVYMMKKDNMEYIK
jgi:hypothetical protein